ncbi:PqqD family protein [Arhodomonas sp. AD133]|uniref:PqqD family protein n=1 Tax=Arhodomonas sp. AD133 TaxID=3415009 RepID=UPI003EC0BBC5
MTDSRPRRRPNLRGEAIGDDYIILDRDGERVHQLNETAGFVWTLIDGERRVDEIVDALCEAYDVSRERAHRDVNDVIESFIAAGLLDTGD